MAAWCWLMPANAHMGQCARYGELDDLKVLLADGRVDGAVALPDGRTALHMACANGHADVAAFLIEQGADLDAPNAEGSTALHWAAVNGHAAVLRQLLDAGASRAVVNKNARTPLDEAIGANHADAAACLQGGLGGDVPDAERSDPEASEDVEEEVVKPPSSTAW